MKVYLSCLIFVAILFAACTSNNPKEVVITGKIEGLKDSTLVHLYELNSQTPFMTDTAFNESFQFVFQDTTVNKLRPITVLISNKRPINPMTKVWIEPGARINITGNQKTFSTWNVESNIPEQQEENKYKEKNKKNLLYMDWYAQNTDSLLILMQSTNDDQIRMQSRQVMDSLRKTTMPIRHKIQANELDLLEQEPTYSELWFSKLQDHAMIFFYDQDKAEYPYSDRLIAIYNKLSDEQKQNEKAIEIGKSLSASSVTKIKEGDKMADADLYDLDGNVKHIADYKDKYRLIDFWATWCGPCLAAIPEMSEVAEKYKDQLVILSINSEEKDTWVNFSQSQEPSSIISLHDPEGEFGLTLNYGVTSIPNYILIDKDDNVVAMWMGYSKGSLNTKMDELLKK